MERFIKFTWVEYQNIIWDMARLTPLFDDDDIDRFFDKFPEKGRC